MQPLSAAHAALLLLLLLWAGGCATRAVPGSANSPPELPEYHPNRVLVKLRTGVASTQALRTAGVKLRSSVGSAGYRSYKVVDGSTVPDAMERLRKLPGVVAVERVYRVYADKVPSDPLSNSQTSPKQWHLAKIKAFAGWDITTGSKDVRMCHVDTGANNHQDLPWGGNIVEGINYASDQSSSDFSDMYAGNAKGCKCPKDSHGTHTAGLLAASSNNGKGVAGVAWKVSVYVCRFIDRDGNGWSDDAIRCLQWCRAPGRNAAISTNSWGGTGGTNGDALYQEIQQHDLFIASAGNKAYDMDSTPMYPAGYNLPNILAVGATDSNDNRASFSNYGKTTVDVFAPGLYIWSTVGVDDYQGLTTKNTQWSGTSFAAPQVAGAAALIKAVSLARGLKLSGQDIKKLILQNVDTVPALKGLAVSSGRLNIQKALQAAQAMPIPPPSPSPRPSPSPPRSPSPSPKPPRPSPKISASPSPKKPSPSPSRPPSPSPARSPPRSPSPSPARSPPRSPSPSPARSPPHSPSPSPRPKPNAGEDVIAQLRFSSSARSADGRAGRLEVKGASAGAWGTICDDGFNDKAAAVACRQVNPAYGAATTVARAVTPDLMAGLQAFGPGSGAILLDDVVCPTGSESSLDQGCRHAAWGVSNCAHTADAAVACFDKAELGAVVPRLQPTAGAKTGRLEVKWRGTWGTACNSFVFGSSATAAASSFARVACRQLGYGSGGSVRDVTSSYATTKAATPVWLANVWCTGSETRLQDCRFAYYGAAIPSTCTHSKDILLTCY